MVSKPTEIGAYYDSPLYEKILGTLLITLCTPILCALTIVVLALWFPIATIATMVASPFAGINVAIKMYWKKPGNTNALSD